MSNHPIHPTPDGRCDHYKLCHDCCSGEAALEQQKRAIALATDYVEATEWNMATLEELALLKSSSTSRVNRQKSICLKMLQKCREQQKLGNINWGDRNGRFSRVASVLATDTSMEAIVDERIRQCRQ